LCADRSGFTALEYTLITVIFGTVVAVGVDVIGNALTTSYANISSVLAQYAAGS
jgi:Flp pilus assembly pilin Flp